MKSPGIEPRNYLAKASMAMDFSLWFTRRLVKQSGAGVKSSSQPRFLTLLVALVLTAGCSSAPDRPASDTALPACGWLPNCVNSESGRGLQAVDPITANDGQWQQLKAWVVHQPDWEMVTDDGNFIQAIVKTPLMRFQDDVQLHFYPDIELIQLRSSSRLGISDLGTNYRRIEALREVLNPIAASEKTSGVKPRSHLHD
jgi:uncharacterized protein (DUF1499 family)